MIQIIFAYKSFIKAFKFISIILLLRQSALICNIVLTIIFRINKNRNIDLQNVSLITRRVNEETHHFRVSILIMIQIIFALLKHKF